VIDQSWNGDAHQNHIHAAKALLQRSTVYSQQDGHGRIDKQTDDGTECDVKVPSSRSAHKIAMRTIEPMNELFWKKNTCAAPIRFAST
jgi:hypothetical protein